MTGFEAVTVFEVYFLYISVGKDSSWTCCRVKIE